MIGRTLSLLTKIRRIAPLGCCRYNLTSREILQYLHNKPWTEPPLCVDVYTI